MNCCPIQHCLIWEHCLGQYKQFASKIMLYNKNFLLDQNTTFSCVMTTEQRMAVHLLCYQGQPVLPTLMFSVVQYLSNGQFHHIHEACGDYEVSVMY